MRFKRRWIIDVVIKMTKYYYNNSRDSSFSFFRRSLSFLFLFIYQLELVTFFYIDVYELESIALKGDKFIKTMVEQFFIIPF